MFALDFTPKHYNFGGNMFGGIGEFGAPEWKTKSTPLENRHILTDTKIPKSAPERNLFKYRMSNLDANCGQDPCLRQCGTQAPTQVYQSFGAKLSVFVCYSGEISHLPRSCLNSRGDWKPACVAHTPLDLI